MAKVRFDDGTVLQFDGTPSPSDIEEAYQQVRATRSSQPASAPSVSTSPFDAPMARQLFPAGGQFIGGLSAAALASPTVAGVAPAAVAGGVGGGIAGESFRQFLASMTGGGPSSYGQAAQGVVNAGGVAAASEALPPLVSALARPVGVVVKAGARALYKNIPDPVLAWVKTRAAQGLDILNYSAQGAKDNVLASVKRLSDALKLIQAEPERLQSPSPKTLYPVAEKAANALEAVRQQVGEQYGEAASHALEQPARASLSKAGHFLTQELRQAKIINAHNKPVPFGVRDFTSEERLLLNLFEDFKGMSSVPPEGLPEAVQPGTFINYDLARRLLGRVDEAMAGARTRNTQRIIGTVRRNIVEGLKASDDRLAKQIPAYGRFVGIRDMVESATETPDRTVALLLNSLKETKAGLRGQLEQLDALAPSEHKFMGDLVAYQQRVQAAETAKRAPKTVQSLLARMKTPQQMEGLITTIFNQPHTTIAELEALEQVSGSTFLDEFKDMAARKLFATYRPSGVGVPKIQGELLRRMLPMILAGQQAGRTAGRFAPVLPPGLSTLIPRPSQN